MTIQAHFVALSSSLLFNPMYTCDPRFKQVSVAERKAKSRRTPTRGWDNCEAGCRLCEAITGAVAVVHSVQGNELETLAVRPSHQAFTHMMAVEVCSCCTLSRTSAMRG